MHSYLEVCMWISNSANGMNYMWTVQSRRVSTCVQGHQYVHELCCWEKYSSDSSAKKLCCGACPEKNLAACLLFLCTTCLGLWGLVLHTCITFASLNSFSDEEETTHWKTFSTLKLSGTILKRSSRPHLPKFSLVVSLLNRQISKLNSPSSFPAIWYEVRAILTNSK